MDRTIRVPFQRFRRLGFFGVVLATTTAGAWMMLGIVGAAGISALEIVILALFVPTFGWISIAFWSSAIGFVLRLFRVDPLTLARRRSGSGQPIPLTARTALVMPAHNEDSVRVMSGLEATLRSLARTGEGRCFDTFLLSDTTDSELIGAEEEAWEELRKRVSVEGSLTYRRRPLNTGRKCGNLADFCERWGEGYDFLVVLDADSIMSGGTLVELVRLMQANPDAGLMQTVPLPARQATLFGRLLQFSAVLYSPIHGAGQSFWQGDAANYWGHNAILRLSAFREHCRLPVLSGQPPLGGEILSHDFVEGGLLRRAGWRVYLISWLDGSLEEVPGNLPDYATRDRRWAQGSLQHLRLLGTRGLHPLSRIHFAMGAMGYLSSLLWFVLLLAASAYVTLVEAGAAPVVTDGLSWLRVVPTSLGGPPLSLLAVTAALLFVPKVFGLIVGWGAQRRLMGGSAKLLVSAVLEAVFAIVIAPVLMIYHTRFVGSVLLGRDVPWDGRTRGGGEVSWGEAWKGTASIVLLGAGWAALTIYWSWAFFLWLTPIFTGLLLAPPIVRWTSRRDLGEWARRAGLFLVPSETDPSHVVSLSARGPGATPPTEIHRPAGPWTRSSPLGGRTRPESARAPAPPAGSDR